MRGPGWVPYLTVAETNQTALLPTLPRSRRQAMIEIKTLGTSPTWLRGMVHIWPVWLRARDRAVARGEAVLSQRERQRADAFRLAHLRRNFVLKHGCLRALLAGYLDIAPEDVQVRVEPSGKPYVVSSTSDLHFNQSDSGEMAVFAFALGRELGVDIELERAIPDLEQLAIRFFSPEETDDLLGLPPEQRARAFVAAWTRKEAYLKTIGEGLRVPLDQFRVTLRPDDKPSIVHIGGDRVSARSWCVSSFQPADGYLGALAYQGGRMEEQVLKTVTASDILDECTSPGRR